MKKITTLIVDDEPLALQILRAKLNKIENIEIVGECSNGREAIEQIMEKSPDLVFLDIQMPGIDGFGVIKKLQTDVMPLIVFTTAFEQYAIDAFDVHAVDYILKPLDLERLQRAVTRVEERILSEDEDAKSRIISAIDSFRDEDSLTEDDLARSEINTPNLERKILIKDRGDITLLKQSDIEWVDAPGDYVCLHAAGVTHIKRSTLKQLLEELDPNVFKRVHRSTIVNLTCIKKVTPHTKGEFFLQLGEYDKVKVSRNYKDVIKQFLVDI
jgi:two-component system, LytTR family, response regulator